MNRRLAAFHWQRFQYWNSRATEATDRGMGTLANVYREMALENLDYYRAHTAQIEENAA